MAFTLVKSSSGTGSNASSCSATFTGGNTGSNLLIAVVAWNNSGRAFTSITDTIGNTWTAATALVSTSTALLRIYYVFNCKATGSNNVVTLNLGGGANCAIAIHEYSGLLATSSVIDQQNTGNNTTANPTTSSITNTVAGDLVFAACNIVSTTAPTSTAGFTREVNTLFTTNTLSTEDQIDAGTGTFAGAWTHSGTAQYATGIASFKVSSGVLSVSSLMMLGC